MQYSTSTCDIVGSSTVCFTETTFGTSTATSTEVVLPLYVETFATIATFVLLIGVFTGFTILTQKLISLFTK